MTFTKTHILYVGAAAVGLYFLWPKLFPPTAKTNAEAPTDATSGINSLLTGFTGLNPTLNVQDPSSDKNLSDAFDKLNPGMVKLTEADMGIVRGQTLVV